MKKHMQKGFAHSGLILLGLVVVAIALIGYKVANNRYSTGAANNSTTAVSSTSVPTINTASDLNKAVQALNGQNVDNDLNPDTLNNDVNSLL